LFKLADAAAGADLAFETDPAKLQDHGAGRRVNQVATQWNLHDRSVALGDFNEARRVVTAQFVQANTVCSEHLVGARLEHEIGTTPHDDRCHHITRSSRVIVEQPKHRRLRQPHPNFLVGLAQCRFDHGFASVDPTARERPLRRMSIQSNCSAAEDERRTTGHTLHTTVEEVGDVISNRDLRHPVLRRGMRIDTVRTVLGINNDDGDGGVTATIERKLETIMRREIQFDPGAKGIVIGDHRTSIADRRSTGRIGSFTHCTYCLGRGGVILAVLDEAMAWACIAIGRRWAVTSETSTRFDRAVYVDKPHLVEAEITEQTETDITTIGRIIDLKGRIRSEARATFTVLGKAQLKRATGETGDKIHESLHLD
jgi:hypothetical protein